MRLQERIARMLGRPSQPLQLSTPSLVPMPIPEHERQQLRDAQVRFPRKWAAFDALIAEHAKEDGFYRLQRR